MNATTSTSTRRLGTALTAAALLTALGASSASAMVPYEPHTSAHIQLVNGIHTAQGVAAKLARQ
jgi:hypothetical protein